MTGKCNILLQVLLLLVLSSSGLFGQTDPSAVSPPGEQSEGDSLVPSLSKKDILLKLIYKDSSRYYTEDRIAAIQADLSRHEGKVIRNIRIRKVDMFAPDVTDTGYVSESWLQRTGNRLHTNTRDKIIMRNILFAPGEKIDVLLLTENERIIRSLPYIMDARFLIRDLPDDSTRADVELLVKDLWPVGFGLEISDIDAGSADIWNANILGFGHQLGTTLFWNGDHRPLFGYNLFYGIANLAGSFVSAQAEYRNSWNRNSLKAFIGRDFKTTGLKYAGAASFENSRITRDIPLLDTTLQMASVDFTFGELWAGRLFSLNGNSDMTMSSNLFLTGGISRIFYRETPETGETYLYDYHDKTQLMFSIRYSHQGFQKDNHIYTFERTEDVPYGYMIEFRSGVEWGQYKTRPYFAGSFAAGNYLAGFGNLFGNFQFGTFVDQGLSEQGLLNLKLRYFSELHSSNRFDFRGFASLTYQHIIHPYEGEYISLENRYGIVGLSSPAMRGDEKLVLSLESVIFSPLKLLGFRFIFFVSSDMGLIWNHNTSLSGHNYFSGLGLGIRIRNDRLVFDTFEIKFSFYPGMPKDGRARYWYAGSVPNLRLTNFYPGSPFPLDALH